MMAYDIGEIQAAIWRTEEAVQFQTERLATETDPVLGTVAMRSLASLRDLLAIQQRMLDVLLKSGATISIPSSLSCGHERGSEDFAGRDARSRVSVALSAAAPGDDGSYAFAAPPAGALAASSTEGLPAIEYYTTDGTTGSQTVAIDAT